MPLKLADLAAKTKTTTFDFDGDTVTMDVRHHLVTPKLLADLSALDNLNDNAPEKLYAIAEQVARLVDKWDVLDIDGTMFPLVADRLSAEIPIFFLVRALTTATRVMTMGEAPAPEAKKGSNSGATC